MVEQLRRDVCFTALTRPQMFAGLSGRAIPPSIRTAARHRKSWRKASRALARTVWCTRVSGIPAASALASSTRTVLPPQSRAGISTTNGTASGLILFAMREQGRCFESSISRKLSDSDEPLYGSFAPSFQSPKPNLPMPHKQTFGGTGQDGNPHDE